MKRKKKLRKIGTSLACIIALSVVGLGPLAGAPRKKPPLETYAVISGTVFQESGYALPDAAVSLLPQASGAPAKSERMEAVSSERGEFTFRVPPGPANYIVKVSAKGYNTQQKTVAVQDQEREEVTFQLQRESK